MNKRSNNTTNSTNNTKSKKHYKKQKSYDSYEYCTECKSELDGYYHTKCFFENKVVCNYCFEELYEKNNKHKSGYGEQFIIPPPPIIPNIPNTLPTDTNKLGIFFAIKNNDQNDATSVSNDPFPNLLNNILNQLHKLDETHSKTTEEPNLEENIDIHTYEWEWLGSNIKNINDLIDLGKKYDPTLKKRFNLNMKILNKLVEPLQQLRDMIGLDNIKKIIFDQLIYYLQNLDDKNHDMLHTVIIGPPGVGKTQLTHIIAKIYNRLGFLKTDKRDDLVGEYIGQTAVKTRKILEKALGGVLLIDEAYSLASNSEKDFARESIDMINAYLSEHAHDLICVIAGYKKPIYEKLLSQNEGLARRFTHHFEIEGYTPQQLSSIFIKIITSKNWICNIVDTDLHHVIKSNIELFPNFGGDMLTLFSCCKKTHSKRLLLISTEEELTKNKKNINLDDLKDAINLYKQIKEKHTNSLDDDKKKYEHMYI